jgi:hypothetical protein
MYRSSDRPRRNSLPNSLPNFVSTMPKSCQTSTSVCSKDESIATALAKFTNSLPIHQLKAQRAQRQPFSALQLAYWCLCPHRHSAAL